MIDPEWLIELESKLGDRKISGQEFNYNCPKCNDYKKHLYVNPIKQIFNCFKCGFSGRLPRLLQHLGIQAKFGQPAVVFNRRLTSTSIEVVPKDVISVLKADRVIFEEELDYLKKRGVTKTLAPLFGVAPDFVYCFPEEKNPMHYWRRFIHTKAFYVPQVQKPVYFLKRASLYPVIVLCEGPFDAIAWCLGSFSHGVALIGRTLTQSQAEGLESALNDGVELCIALDSDAKQSYGPLLLKLRRLKPKFKLSFIQMPEGLDADELPIDKRYQLLYGRVECNMLNLVKYYGLRVF